MAAEVANLDHQSFAELLQGAAVGAEDRVDIPDDVRVQLSETDQAVLDGVTADQAKSLLTRCATLHDMSDDAVKLVWTMGVPRVVQELPEICNAAASFDGADLQVKRELIRCAKDIILVLLPTRTAREAHGQR